MPRLLRRCPAVTVYVDDWRQLARVGRITARWSHLTVGPDDDLAELHDFAARIGLRRSWFQDKPWPRAHYDVTDAKRGQALAAGAVPITWREAGRRRLDALAAPRAAAPGDEPAPAWPAPGPCPGPGADWQEAGWCCRTCAVLAHPAWCPDCRAAGGEP